MGPIPGCPGCCCNGGGALFGLLEGPAPSPFVSPPGSLRPGIPSFVGVVGLIGNPP